MAAIGLQYCAYAPLTENEEAGTYSYGIGKRGRKMMKADIKLNISKSPLYADDNIAEYAREFIDGEININQDELTSTMKKDFLGNTARNVVVGEETIEEIVSTDTDTPPYVGFGFIQPKIIDKVRMYRAIFYKKVQFGEPDESGETKGQSINWQTPTIVGTIMRALDGEWKEEITVSSLATAIAWLTQKLNLPPVTTLKSLFVGALELTPAFSSTKTNYAATTTNDSDLIVAVPLDPEATVAIDLNDGTAVTNGTAATWDPGENELVITVTNGAASTTYTVVVTAE